MKNSNTEKIAVELLWKLRDQKLRKKVSAEDTWLYLCLVLDGTRRGWSSTRHTSALSLFAGMKPHRIKASLKKLEDAGLLKFGVLIPTPKMIHERAMDSFEVVSREYAKKNGYKPVTYAYKEHEMNLFNALLVQNFNEPVLVVEYESKGKRMLELWRHNDSIARYSQAEEVLLGGGITRGEFS